VSSAKDHTEAHVVIESPDDSPVDVLQQATGLSKQRIKLAMTQGAVWVTRGRNTRRLRRVKRALHEGDEVHLYYDAGILAEIPREPTLIETLWIAIPGFEVGRSLYRGALGRTASAPRTSCFYSSPPRHGR
jgi:hypothetical protein